MPHECTKIGLGMVTEIKSRS